MSDRDNDRQVDLFSTPTDEELRQIERWRSSAIQEGSAELKGKGGFSLLAGKRGGSGVSGGGSGVSLKVGKGGKRPVAPVAPPVYPLREETTREVKRDFGDSYYDLEQDQEEPSLIQNLGLLATGLSEQDQIDSFRKLKCEIALKIPRIVEPVWVVADYTDQGRQEIAISDLMIFMRVLSAFPGAKLVDFIQDRAKMSES